MLFIEMGVRPYTAPDGLAVNLEMQDTAPTTVGTLLDQAASTQTVAFAPTAKLVVKAQTAGKYTLTSLVVDSAGLEQSQGYGPQGVRRIRTSIEGVFALAETTPVRAAVEGMYRSIVSAFVEASYVLIGRVQAAADLRYNITNTTPVRAAVAGEYRSKVSASADGTYSYLTRMRSATQGKYHMTAPLQAALTGTYKLRDRETVQAACRGVWAMPGSYVANLTQAPFIQLGPDTIHLTDAEISTDEGGFLWQGAFGIASLADYSKFKRDTAFTVNIYGDVFHFIVDGKELDRDAPEGYQARVTGVSPGAAYDSPRMQSQDYLWETATTAAAVAEALMPGITWGVVDYTIPAFRLGASSATPVEIVRTLAEAVGGVLESGIDGSIYVRRRYPVSVLAYVSALPDHTLTELPDILSVSEGFTVGDTFNRALIGDVDQSISDSLEWVPDFSGAKTGLIRAYLYPWRGGTKLIHTGADTVSVGYPDVVIRTEEELVEVFENHGTVSFPIYDVVSVVWEAKDLGGIVFSQDSKELSVSGEPFNGLVRLTYRTRSMDYRVALPSGRPTQFLLESTTL